jgi:hypothetical protein
MLNTCLFYRLIYVTRHFLKHVVGLFYKPAKLHHTIIAFHQSFQHLIFLAYYLLIGSYTEPISGLCYLYRQTNREIGTESQGSHGDSRLQLENINFWSSI